MNYNKCIAELEKCIEEIRPKCFSNKGYSETEQEEALNRVSILSQIIGRLVFERDKENELNNRKI